MPFVKLNSRKKAKINPFEGEIAQLHAISKVANYTYTRTVQPAPQFRAKCCEKLTSGV
jgi:hypothetical protein